MSINPQGANQYGEDMPQKHSLTLLIFFALTATISANAQENEKFKTVFGLQASIAMPTSKLDPNKRSGEIGITNGKGGGVFIEFIWRNKHALRAQYDHIAWDRYEYGYWFSPEGYASGNKREFLLQCAVLQAVC